MIVIETSVIIYGPTIKMLWLKLSGPENRDIDKFSIGPKATIERADFRMGSIIVAVASVYSSIGETKAKALTIRARRRISSGLAAPASGVNELSRMLAPMEMKNEKNIQSATAARADVAVLRKKIENKMAMPSQKEI